jgi:hypothetical protein
VALIGRCFDSDNSDFFVEMGSSGNGDEFSKAASNLLAKFGASSLVTNKNNNQLWQVIRIICLLIGLASP